MCIPLSDILLFRNQAFPGRGLVDPSHHKLKLDNILEVDEENGKQTDGNPRAPPLVVMVDQ